MSCSGLSSPPPPPLDLASRGHAKCWEKRSGPAGRKQLDGTEESHAGTKPLFPHRLWHGPEPGSKPRPAGPPGLHLLNQGHNSAVCLLLTAKSHGRRAERKQVLLSLHRRALKREGSPLMT